jgi:hypothetical protein
MKRRKKRKKKTNEPLQKVRHNGKGERLIHKANTHSAFRIDSTYQVAQTFPFPFPFRFSFHAQTESERRTKDERGEKTEEERKEGNSGGTD